MKVILDQILIPKVILTETKKQGKQNEARKESEAPQSRASGGAIQGRALQGLRATLPVGPDGPRRRGHCLSFRGACEIRSLHG